MATRKTISQRRRAMRVEAKKLEAQAAADGDSATEETFRKVAELLAEPVAVAAERNLGEVAD